MGFRFGMGDYGTESEKIKKECQLLDESRLLTVEYFSKGDEKAAEERSANVQIGLRIVGTLNYDLDGMDNKAEDPQKQIVEWAMTPSSADGAYRHVIVTVLASDQTVREYNFPEAYVASYEESQDEKDGWGKFELVLRQKQDTNNLVNVSASFPDETAG